MMGMAAFLLPTHLRFVANRSSVKFFSSDPIFCRTDHLLLPD